MRRITTIAALLVISWSADPGQAGEKAGRAYWVCVSNEGEGTVTILNGADRKVVATIPVGKRPRGIHASPDGKFAYVTCETGGEVFVIDTKTNKAVAEIPVGGRPRNVAFLPDGSRAFVPSETAGTLSIVDTATHKILQTIRLPVGSRPMGVA